MKALQDSVGVGGSSQSKTLESSLGPFMDLVRAAIVDRPLEHMKTTICRCSHTSVRIPGASILMSILQHIQMTIRCCLLTSPLIPAAADHAHSYQGQPSLLSHFNPSK